MNTLVSKTNRINRRMESSPIQRKLQKVSRDADENNYNAKLRTPQQRKVRRVRSSDNHSSRSASASRRNDWAKENHSEHMSPLQRKLLREDSTGKSGTGSGSSGGGSGNGSSSSRTTAQSVIELLELLQSSPYAIMKNEVSAIKYQRKPPERSHSEELFTPSRRHKRTGVRIPLRMMPKVKPASMGDLYDENGTRERRSGRKKDQSPKGLIRKGRKGDYRFKTDEFQSDSSPRSPRSKMNQEKQDRWNLDDCDKIPKSTFVADFDNQDKTKNMQKPTFKADFDNQNEIKNIQDFIDIESSRPSTEKRTSNADESYDSSFFQEAPSTLGDFHIGKSHRRNRPTKYQDSPVKVDQRPVLRDRRPKGLVTHTSSNISDSTREEDDKARRRRTRCSAGGKVRNHRTQEEYTGFFLTSPTEDNLKHGYGITKYPDGRLFEGVYERGTMVEGKMTYPAAAGSTAPTYVGKFDEAGYRCGKGIYTTATTTFLGQFRRDQQHGSGILIFHDGNDGADTSQSRRFIGHWKDGLKHGHGREILANGTIAQEGMWEAGRFVGAVTSPRRRV